MMCVAAIAVATVTWAAVGYSLAFDGEGDLIGGLGNAFMSGVDFATREEGSTIPELVFFAFQATFCIITVALISGAVVERMRFGAFLLACVHPEATPGAPALDLDKAATVLRAWLQLLRAAGFAEPPSTTGADEAAQRWWSAFTAARDAVNARVQQRFGFALSLR